MEKIIEIPATMTSLSYTKDRSLRLGFVTQELTNEEKNKVETFFQSFGYLLFKENSFQEKDIPKLNAEIKGKSLSQIQRNTMFAIWNQSDSKISFEEYYKNRMLKNIEFLRAELNKG